MHRADSIERMHHAGGRGGRRDVVVEEHGHYLQHVNTRSQRPGVDKLDDVGDDDQRPQYDGDRKKRTRKKRTTLATRTQVREFPFFWEELRL